MSSTIRNADLLQTLPFVLSNDETYHQLAAVIAEQLRKMAESVDDVTVYAAIDRLPESLLDLLAYDFKIDWWRPDASIEEKRTVLQNSWYVHRHIGTPSAIERAIVDYFGGGKVSEWPEYGGDPFHFRITSENNSLIVENYAEFMSVLNAVKRVSAVLDSITSVLAHEQQLYIGMAMRVAKTGSASMDPVEITVYTMLADENDLALTDEFGTVLIDA